MKVCPICSTDFPQGDYCPADGATLVDKQRRDPLIGKMLKDMYRIESRLAEGGMSLVYVARQLSLDRLVVVKLLRAGMDDHDFIQLFFREARIASQLNHPNVMHVIDFGNTDDGMMYLVVEYLRGENLSELVEKRSGLPLENVVWLLEQIGAGLQAAHQMNIVHRDLKPGNIIVARVSGDHSVAKLLDFGISKPLGEGDLKYTRLGMVMGTPGYLAPEQIEGARNIDKRADIYALGAILYYCITGERPYTGESPQDIMNRQCAGPPPALRENRLTDARNKALEPVILKAMALRPDDRYPDAQAMVRDIQNRAHAAITEYSKAMEMAPPNPDVYQFIFYGEIRGDVALQDTQEKLKAALGLSDAACARLFSGKRVVVKKNLSLGKAKKYDEAFQAAGALGQIEEMDTATRIDPAHNMDERSMSQPIVVAASTLAEPMHLGSQPPPFGVQGYTHPVAPVLDEDQATTVVGPGTPAPMAPGVATAPGQSARRRAPLWLSLTALMFVLLGVGYAIPVVRYSVADGYAELTGWQAPRGVSENRVALGMSAAFSGGARELGRAMQLGVDVRIREINEKGGIHGRYIELRALDDGYEPAAAHQNVEKFMQPDGVFAMLGNVGTPTAETILPVALKDRTIVFGTFSGAALLRKSPPERYVFNYRASYEDETSALIRYFIEEQDVDPRMIAVFYQDDGYGQDGLKGVEDALSDYGVRPHEIAKFSYQRNTAQIEGAAQGMLSRLSDIQAVVAISTYTASARLTKRLRQAGFTGPFANVSFVGARALAEQFKELGMEYGEGVVVSQVVPPFDSYATGVLRYREALSRFYPNEQPDFISLEGYIVATLFFHALEQAGRHFDTESLVDTLESFDGVDLGIGETISFHASDHQGSHRVWGTQLNRDGAFEAVRLSKKETL
ncbi:ABC transporter substrate-binding protein [Hahella aquimaris]|uniref:ABC transporter substrate-binding protein n=1 Tax=Hahella sp. HNIBRBA332 TaxID=3015983 RepID=UPI00273B4786|nr:ABC transporter substrate-binding protein [Hahella sp. HNIBRBA332]WLQ11651.1 ABC transporter substrate-binding protein [Hahella sp. HNIBRBA332]